MSRTSVVMQGDEPIDVRVHDTHGVVVAAVDVDGVTIQALQTVELRRLAAALCEAADRADAHRPTVVAS